MKKCAVRNPGSNRSSLAMKCSLSLFLNRVLRRCRIGAAMMISKSLLWLMVTKVDGDAV